MNKTGSDLQILENVPLAPYTTLGVGGPARFLVKAVGEDQILAAMDFSHARSCPVFMLGGGSNVVISDDGFPGLVIKVEIADIQPLGDVDCHEISAGAGVEWDAFVRHCVAKNLAGIECLSGIPGTVGGAPIQNIGAYGEEASDVVLRVRALDRESFTFVELGGADCRFAYRSSIFNTTQKDRYVLLRVDFALRADGKPTLQYQDLQHHFGFGSPLPTIEEVREAVLRIRKSKAMVLEDGDPDSRSVGSFFKNPILNYEDAAVAEETARSRGILGSSESIPRFPAPEGQEKLPAAWLIERAGFRKGYALGHAGISGKHALAIINKGGARAQEILDLMRVIQDGVMDAFGIGLQPEPVFVGFGN